MKAFKDGAPVRLVLPWEPPVHYENEADWESVLANDIDTPGIRNVLGHFDRYEVKDREIHFYMHTTRRRLELKKLMRDDKHWKRFVQRYPELKVEWAEDVAE